MLDAAPGGTASDGWPEKLVDALERFDPADQETVNDARELAHAAHKAMVAAHVVGELRTALRIAEMLDQYAPRVFVADPESQHAIWNDYGALLYESGNREFAVSVLRSALAAHDRWLASEGAGTLLRRELAHLRTLTTLISILASLGDIEEALEFQERGAAGAFSVGMSGRKEGFEFDIAVAQLLAARGSTGDAETILLRYLEASRVRPSLKLPLCRVTMQLAHLRIARRRYDKARVDLDRADQLIDPRSLQDSADLQQAWALFWFKVAANEVGGSSWTKAAAYNREAARIRASGPVRHPSGGCQEEALFGVMAMREGDFSRGRAHLARGLRLARSISSHDESMLQNMRLTSAALAMAAGRPGAAAARTRRIMRDLDTSDSSDREVLLDVLPVHAEALRRAGDLKGAADSLERVLDLEAAAIADAVMADWGPYDVTLARRGHESLNAYVDAALAAGGADDPHAIFARVAAAKDLGLRTLRKARGAAPAVLKQSTVANDIAAQLPRGAAYIEFFIHRPRRIAIIASGWDAPRLFAFTLDGRGCVGLRLHDLGPLARFEREVSSLSRGSEGKRRRALRRLGKLLAPVVRAVPHETLFIAPDGVMAGVPFAAIPIGWRRWIESARIALVESAAAILTRNPEGGAQSGATVVTAADVGRYGLFPRLPSARIEGGIVADLLKVAPVHLDDVVGAADDFRSALTRAYGIFHFSGHAERFERPGGLYWEPSRAAQLEAFFDPYAQSRIICGGFNDWAAGQGSADDLDRVSVSAAELAAIDLRRLRLMIFGACNCAVGAVQPLESSTSLATAARVGGAGAVVAAIWAVPDAATLRLMSYLHWIEPATGSSVEALRLAQLSLKDDGVGAWASWVIWAGPDDIERLRIEPARQVRRTLSD